jgi:hypothetical protein
MPYYVYSVHTDSKSNDLYGSFVDYQGAEICERDQQRGRYSAKDNLVLMVYAQNQTHALQKIKQIRRERGLPTK